MADSFQTAEYGQEDTPTSIDMHFERLTTTELTALATARKVGIGKMYYDTTVGGFKLGLDAGTVSAVITLGGLPSAVAITGGTINGTSVGATTRSTVAATTISQTTTDQTGTPGNVTNNNGMGRAAFAAAGTAVVVTNSSVAATDSVFVSLLGAADATLTSVNVTSIGAGTFTVTGNAAATAAKSFMWHVIKS